MLPAVSTVRFISVDHSQKTTELIFFFSVAVRLWWTESLWAGITPSGTWGWGLVCCHVSASKSTPGSGDGLTGPPWRPDGGLAWHYGHGQSPLHAQTCSKLIQLYRCSSIFEAASKMFHFLLSRRIRLLKFAPRLCTQTKRNILKKLFKCEIITESIVIETYSSEALNIHRSFIRYCLNFSFVYRLTTKIKHRVSDSCGNILECNVQ
jgi:hypothetical protein